MASRSLAFTSAKTTLLGQGGKMLVQVASMTILARILDPSQFGLYGMVAVFVGIGLLIGDLGLSTASIQSKSLSNTQRTNLFWINLGIGVTLCALFAALAGSIARMYGEPALREVVYVVALLFIIQSAAAQFAANATRDLRFRVLATSDVVSQSFGLIVAVVAALYGFGVWALVAQQLAVALCNLGILAFTSPWRPGVPRKAPMRDLVSYGLHTFGVQALNYISSTIDSFIIGRFLGATQLGFYDRAYQLNRIPTQQLATPLTRVALPLLAKHQDDADEVSARLRTVCRAMAYVLGGLIVLIGANAMHVVAIALGDQWGQSVGPLSILALGGYFQAVGYVYFWAFLALGRTALQLRFSLISRPLMVALVCVGLIFGLNGVAIGVSAGLILNWLILSLWAMPRTGVGPLPLVAIALRAFAVWASSAYVVAWLQLVYFSDWGHWSALMVNVISAVLLASTAMIVPACRHDVVDIVRFVRSRRHVGI